MVDNQSIGASGQKISRQIDRAKLRQMIVSFLSESELRDLCFDLEVDYDSLQSDGKSGKARELVAHLDRHGRISELVKTGEQLRPDIAWSDTLEIPPELPSAPPGLSSEQLPSTVLASLPPKYYHQFIGRSSQLGIVMDALRPPKAKPMIAIIGLGGMGKTALAREATELCRHERLCDYVVWTSAQTERFIGEGIIKTEISDYSFDTLLSDIGRQCGRMEIVQASVEHKTGAVKHLLADKHVLIVLDNLETVLERDNLVDNVFRILGKSKLLITSRYRVKHEQVYTILLGGFTEDESAEFLCMEGEERNIEVITQASRSELIEIHQVTGGAPLAMKLVVGQMSEQPMYKVMESFKKVSFQSQDYEFYRFLFKRSWDMLSSDAKKVLIAMSCFALTIGGTWEAVRDISGMKEAEPALHSAMRQLVLMSLIDPVGDINQRRYVIHPLTNYFILSDIVKEWG